MLGLQDNSVINALADKLFDLSFTLGPTWGKERTSSNKLSFDFHTLWHVCPDIHAINIKNMQNLLKNPRPEGHIFMVQLI